MKVFSFSRLNLYKTCPYRFYKKYIEGFEEPVTYPLALGKGVHKAIEQKLNGSSHEQAVLSGVIEADFHEEVTKEEISRLTKNAPIHQVSGKIETYFKIPLSDEEDSPMVQGFIDVSSPKHIIDWKTNRIPYNVRGNHQIGVYSWAISQLTGSKNIYGELYFLRFKRSSGYLYNIQDMEEARKWAYETAKEIQGKLALAEAMQELKDDLFPAKTSRFCSHCPVAVECYRKFAKYQN